MPYHVNCAEYFWVRNAIHISVHGEGCYKLHFPLPVNPHIRVTYLDFWICREDVEFFEELYDGFCRVDEVAVYDVAIC